MAIADLARVVPGARLQGDPGTPVTAVVADSRQVVPGAVFVALEGEHHDGRDFIPDALAAGATAIVVDRPVDARVVQLVADDPRAALPHLAATVYGNPSGHLRVTGVTGTDGKTTTCRFLDHILSATGRRTGRMDSLGVVVDGHEVRPCGPLTTAQADDVQWLLYEMVRAGAQDAIVEASSAGLSAHRLDAVRFRVGIITNITDEHLEDHGGVEAYHAAKALLVEKVAAEGGVVIANGDDPRCRTLLAACDVTRLSFSLRPTGSDVCADRIELGASGSRFTLCTPYGKRRVAIGPPGGFNVANALAAASAALALGIDLDSLTAALQTLPAVEGRMTVIDEGQPFRIYVDYAHTIAGIASVLAHLRARHPEGRLIAVMASGFHRDHWKRPQIAKTLIAGADLVIFTGSDVVWGTPAEVLAQLSTAARDSGAVEGQDFLTVANRRAAIDVALRAAGPQDTVALLGKGHEPTIIIDGERQPWSEVAEVKRAIGRLRG